MDKAEGSLQPKVYRQDDGHAADQLSHSPIPGRRPRRPVTIQRHREFQPRELLDGPAHRAPAFSLFQEQPEMSRASKAFVVLMMGVMGLWGCAQGPANGPTAERIKSLETKCAKLDEDYKAATEARDLLKKKLAALATETNPRQHDLDEQTRLAN